MNNNQKQISSKVEQIALAQSKHKHIYSPTEKISVIEIDNFPLLGKLTALRFLEWVQYNPDGVVALPTGKTPEHFIKWVITYLNNWNQKDIQRDLEINGINPSIKPNMKSLVFVQIDEFFPINPSQANSFHHYIMQYYIKGFGLNPKKALLIDVWGMGVPKNISVESIFTEGITDLSLRTRLGTTRKERIQKKVIESIDQYCTEYEAKIRTLGGIGFFLGGIGPDGHIGFNVRGSDHFSTTRLTQTNYETQAAAATDLGGIEIARSRLVITIGLSTITYNPDVVAIIIAAGEAKAKLIQDSVEKSPSNIYPATVLHQIQNATFYLTKGAASFLTERQYEDLIQKDPIPQSEIEKHILNLSLKLEKPLLNLNKKDLMQSRYTNFIQQKTGSPQKLCKSIHKHMIQKLHSGLQSVEDQTFMHTAPHHDDIMLGYWAYIVHLVRTPRNQHYFNYMTSGFNAVTNSYVLDRLENVLTYLNKPLFSELLEKNYFETGNQEAYDRDTYIYLDGVAAHSKTLRQEGESRRMIRNLMSLFDEGGIDHLKNRVHELISYFQTQYPGKKDLPYIQQFKGMIREWECDLLWGYLGFNSQSINHLRLGFYKGDIFTENPTIERDVKPVLNLMKNIHPTIVTVALDPEGSGPDTHYKVLQTIAEALKAYQKESGRENIEVWGYRNVWYRFHPAESDIIVPVSLNSFAVLESAFNMAFGSQRDASFPSYELEAPFSRLASKIMVEQYRQMQTFLGSAFFNENKHPRIRAAHGMVYLRKMSLDEFYSHSNELKQSTETSVTT